METKPLIVICGPTATGKTETALSIARACGGALISADSRQLYQGVDILSGRGRRDRSEVSFHNGIWHEQGIPIYLYDCLSPTERPSAGWFATEAQRIITSLQHKGTIPILVGGTGLYIQATIGARSLNPRPAQHLREELLSLEIDTLQQRATEQGITLNESDWRNPRRLMRALERKANTEDSHPAAPTPTLTLGLCAPSETLRIRIEERTMRMISEGAITEVRTLMERYPHTSPIFETIGCREFTAYLKGEYTQEEACARKNSAEMKYVKRQMTWFKKDPSIQWVDTTETDFGRKVMNLVRLAKIPS